LSKKILSIKIARFLIATHCWILYYPNNSSPNPHFPFLTPILYYSFIYAFVYQITSSLKTFTPMHAELNV